MSRDRGKDFEKEFRESFEAAGGMIERIPDKVYWNGRRMASEKTKADFLAYVGDGDRSIPLMIECKATGDRRIAFDALQEHQGDALAAFEAFHPSHRSFVAVNVYDRTSLRLYNELYMVPAGVWFELRGTLGRKSIPESVLVEDARVVRCPRAPGSIYDLGPLMGRLKNSKITS